ncbi:MAG: ABC transporter ATP-binding protein/permease [Alphaproteobacteria bacterium]|nr:ABC transporter ATP-binding protein/permease [Alphaproteobacteria bacterium]
MNYWYMLKKYYAYAGKYRHFVVLGLFFHIVATTLWTLTPVVFGMLLNAIQLNSGDMLVSETLKYMAIFAGMILLGNVMHRVGQYFSLISAFYTKKYFVSQHYKVVTQLPLPWHAENHSGDTINRINTAAGSLDSFGGGQHTYINVYITIVVSIVALFFYSPMSLLFGIICFGTLFAVIRPLDIAIAAQSHQMNERHHRVLAAFFDFVSNMRTIITLKLGDKTRQDLDAKQQDVYKPYYQEEIILSAAKWFFLPVMGLLYQLAVLGWYVYQKLFAGAGDLMVGNLSAMWAFANNLNHAFMGFIGKQHELIGARVAMEAVDPITKALPAEAAKQYRIGRSWKKIIVSGLTFGYGKKNVLDNFDIEMKHGQKIAITGESGAGKSTLMAILRGFYQPNSGDVFIDGKQQSGGVQSLASITTLMPQDPEVFENTIEYNITLGLGYPKETVEKVIAISRFDKVLTRLPNGLQTDLKEKGVNLSGGERQRLALARNILAAMNSQIILMDEPTSSIDSKNEGEIYRALFAYFKDKTIIASVHKPYLLPMFDKVVDVNQP